jgi:hypothetical protein
MISCNEGLPYPSMCGLGYDAGLPGLLKGVWAGWHRARRSARTICATITNSLVPLFFLQNIIPNLKQGFWLFDT